MKWDEVEISDIDSHYRKKIISATIYIKTQEQSLNIMDDTELLNHIRPVQKPLKIVKSKKFRTGWNPLEKEENIVKIKGKIIQGRSEVGTWQGVSS